MGADIDQLNIKIEADAQKAHSSVDTLISKLGRLNAALGGINTSNLASLSNGIQRLSNSMQSMKNVGTADFTRLAKNIQKMGSLDANSLSNAAGSIHRFVNALGTIDKINVSDNAAQIGQIAKGISQLGYKSSTQAIENIPKLATAMRQLMTELSKAPRVSQNLIQMTEALAKLGRTGASSGRAATSLGRALDSYTASTGRASRGTFSLASALGKMYATYWLLFRAFGKIGEAIDISSDLTEVQNVVDVTFGNMAYKVEEFAKTSIQQFGMSELSLKQYASRFQAMGSAMGISGASIGNANSFLNKQTNGYIGLSDSMSDVSLNLTKLTADMASFYNVEQKVVAEDLEAIFTGMTRPLRTYGLDLTEATLKEWAMKNGLDANIDSMTQAEKTMLRYQYVMANTGAAQGDFARTANTWANQVRILKQNFQQLASVIGGVFINALKPLVSALNAAMSHIIAFAETISNALGKIFGWKYESGGGGMTTDFGNAADSADDIADSTGTAAKNIEKMQAGLRAFDELKTIDIKDSSSDSGSGGSGSGGASGGGSSGGQWVEQDSIFDTFKSDIDSLYELGEYIGKTLTDAMNSIDWDSVYEGARNFGKGLADFLNGLISPELFGALGRTIAGALNTAIYAALSFGETFDWSDFGLSIATGINEFFKTFDFKALAQTINVWAKGLLDALISALENTDWKRIGRKIGEFITEIDFLEIGKKVGKAIWDAINAGIDLLAGIFSVGSIESTILTAISLLAVSLGSFKALEAVTSIFQKIGTSFSGMLSAIEAHPIMAIASAVVALGVAFKTLERSRMAEAQGNFEEYCSSIGVNITEATASVNEHIKTLQELNKKAADIENEAQAQGAALDSLKEKYIELANKTSLTNEEQELMKYYAEQLIQEVPTLAGVIDETTGKYTGQKDELEKLINAQKEYYLTLGYKDILTEYGKEMAEASVNIDKLEKEYSDLTKQSEELIKYWERVKDETDPFTEQDLIDLTGFDYGEVEDILQGIGVSMDENREAFESYNEELKLAEENFDTVSASMKAHKEEQKKLTESTATYQQAIKDLETDLASLDLTLSEDFLGNLVMEGYDSSGLIEFFNSLKMGVQTSSSELQSVFQELGLSLPDALATAVETKSPEAQSAAVELLISLQSGEKAEEAELISLFSNLGVTLPDNLINNLSQQEAPLQSKAIELLTMIENGYGLTAPNLQTLFDKLGLYLPEELLQSLGEKEADVQNQTIELLGQIAAGYDFSAEELLSKFESLGLDLPDNLQSALKSENEETKKQAVELLEQILTAEEDERDDLIDKFNDLGTDVADKGVIKAMNNKQGDTKNATNNYIDNGIKKPLETQAGSVKSQSENIGKNIVEGTNNGIANNQSSTQGVIGTWVSSIIGYFKGALGIHSPSKVFAEFGGFTTEGFNEGIEDNMSSSYKLMGEWAKGLADNFNLKTPELGFKINRPDSILGSFRNELNSAVDIGAYNASVNGNISTEINVKMGEYINEVRRQNMLMEEQNRLLKGIYEKPIIQDSDVFSSFQRSQRQYFNTRGKTGIVGVD